MVERFGRDRQGDEELGVEEAELLHRWVPLGEAVDAVLEGRLTNGTAVAALLALQTLRARGRETASLRPADAPFMARPGRD